MDCPSCAGTVERALSALDGVCEHECWPATGTVRITYDPAATDPETIADTLESVGYEVECEEQNSDEHTPRSVWRTPRAVRTLLAGIAFVAGLLVHFFIAANPSVVAIFGAELSVADLLFLLAVGVGGAGIVREGLSAARTLDLSIDFLMSVAILSATGVSLVTDADLFFEAATIAVLFNLSELLERYSVDRARNSLTELLSLSPDTAVVKRNGSSAEIPVEEIEIGEIVAVEPGEKVPMDGEVIDGFSTINQAPITGESVPVGKESGDDVFAGTINQQGYLEIEVTSDSSENTLARIAELVEGAQTKKTDRERFIERFSAYYTPIVVAAAVVTATVPPLLGAAWETWFLRGISLLVIACPCAFVISTPVSVVSGVTSAARNGVLVKGGTYLEAMGEVDTVVFDKTGTLTTGELEVTDIVPLNDNDTENVLRCARGLEARSEHPVGAAITEHAVHEGVPKPDVEGFEAITGRGVRASLDGVSHYAGTPALFEELEFDLDHVHLATDGGIAVETESRCAGRNDCLDLLGEAVPRLESEGKTVVLVGTDEELEGVIAVADAVRRDAARVVESLRSAGLHTVMLTGDNEGTARAVAETVGIEEYRAELLPEEKVTVIEDLTDGGRVAMVGDGVNDAPALAAASVGIAMGAAGSDTAIETADIALLGDDLSKLPYLYDLSRTATRVIRQSIYGSLGVKALLAVGIPLGYVSVALAILAGDVGMTSAVTANAMRLARIVPEDTDE
ncbi:MAG TPA: cation-translocating P-type ATPase [Halococcus sp.]|nr:cation-translocating P-type ATPase [Halococcus sp.]